MIARIVIWNLFDSKTTLEELRDRLPPLADGDAWLANDVQERFGLVSFREELPELEGIRDLIGKPPDVYEEFDVVEP